jgi:hypothetical protein
LVTGDASPELGVLSPHYPCAQATRIDFLTPAAMSVPITNGAAHAAVQSALVAFGNATAAGRPAAFTALLVVLGVAPGSAGAGALTRAVSAWQTRNTRYACGDVTDGVGVFVIALSTVALGASATMAKIV